MSKFASFGHGFHRRRGFGIGSIGIFSAAAFHLSPFNVIADSNTTSKPPIRIAIIGSGVGGASTCYFLRELLNDNGIDREVTMDLYEKNDYVGGRVRSVNLEAYSGGTYKKDIGATIIIKQNHYMMNFGKNVLNLPIINESDSDGGLGFAFFDEPRGKLSAVFDGKWGTLKLLRSWGFLHFAALMYNARRFVSNFGQIYELQKNGVSFDNAIDLWNALNLGDTLYGNGMQYVNDEINKFVPWFLQKRQDTNQWAPATLQLVTALTRNNYTQEPEDLPPIVTAGAVSTLAANGLCYVADGGNNLIEQGLIEASHTRLYLNAEVKAITKNRRNQKYVLNHDAALEYDYVIIAAPLCLTGIEFDIDDHNVHSECTQQIEVLSKQQYVDVHKHYVKGTLNPKYFGFSDKDALHLENVGTIFSSNGGALSKYVNNGKQRVTFQKLPCTTIGRFDDSKWVRFMGAQPFTEEILDEIMLDWDRDSLQKFFFKAYPKFKWNREHIDCLGVEEQKKVLRFCLDKNTVDGNGGLYNLNVLESGMSAQEVMAVAGKNVALLVYQQIDRSKD